MEGAKKAGDQVVFTGDFNCASLEPTLARRAGARSVGGWSAGGAPFFFFLGGGAWCFFGFVAGGWGGGVENSKTQADKVNGRDQNEACRAYPKLFQAEILQMHGELRWPSIRCLSFKIPAFSDPRSNPEI